MPIRNGPVTFPPAAGGRGLMLPALEIAAVDGVNQINVEHAAMAYANARLPIPRTLPDRADLDCIAKNLKLY